MAYCLFWFIFPSGSEDSLNDYVFPLVVLLAKGKKVALPLIYLGCFCNARLDECVVKCGRSIERYDVVSCMDSVFLQTFLCEHFEALRPAPIEYSSTVPGGTEVVSASKIIYRACALRWVGEKQSTDT